MITHIVELSCDHDGCDVAYAPSVDEITSVEKTRVGSVIAGWTRADRLDYCPDHKPASRSVPPRKGCPSEAQYRRHLKAGEKCNRCSDYMVPIHRARKGVQARGGR